MVLECPKCSKTVPDDSVYCPYCGYGIKPWARTIQVSVGGTLIMVTTATSLILFAFSIKALAQIYNWYPPVVAQNFIVSIQMLAVFTFAGFVFGLSASILSLIRRNYRWTMASTVLCTLSSTGSCVMSIIVPASNWGTALFYFFLPLLIPALTGTVLIFPRKAEFKREIQQSKKSS